MTITSCSPDGKPTSLRALALYSGSLESALAVHLALEAGVAEIFLVYFRSPFFSDDELVGLWVRQDFPGRPFRSVTLKRDFLRWALSSPPLPLPCTFCRHVMLRRAARMLKRLHFDLVVTGEILGKHGLQPEELLAVEKNAGLEGRVLRPLSAQLLPPTWAEQAGLVHRSLLLNLRWSEQAEEEIAVLAQQRGLTGSRRRECLLVDAQFLARFRDSLSWEKPTANTVQLARFPHCYKIQPEAKVVIAATREEQKDLHALFLPTDIRLYLPWPGSPLALVRAQWYKRTPQEREQILRAAAEKLLQVAGLPMDRPWSICYRCEAEEETHHTQLEALAPASTLSTGA